MAGNANFDDMIGPHKSALMMRAIGADRARRLMTMMSEDEIDILGRAMDDLGVVGADELEIFLDKFADLVRLNQPLTGQAGGVPATTVDVEVTQNAPARRPNLIHFSA